VLTIDEAHRIAKNIAKLPTYLAANPDHDVPWGLLYKTLLE